LPSDGGHGSSGSSSGGNGSGSGSGSSGGDPDAPAGTGHPIQNVMFVLMARQSWSNVSGSASSPYINGTLLPMGAHAEAYFAAPAQLGQAEPNVVWLEAGDNLGITSNGSPSQDVRSTTSHLVDQLEAAGITWKAYVDHMTPGECPIVDQYPMRTWHVPFLFFDDVVGNPPSSTASRCLQHLVPLTDLTTDLQNGMPRYAFIVPDFCEDMHDDCNNSGDPVRQGDDWLSTYVPRLLASKAYADGGAVFIAWDYTNDGYLPIGFIALGANAKAGYASHAQLTTSSTLRSLQEIFGVGPPLRDAANANDVGDLFVSFP
jgi:hypothetical protein